MNFRGTLAAMRPVVLALLLLVACVAAADDGVDRGPVGEFDGGAVDDVDAQELVDVSHARELRGLWVASVWNLDLPSQQGLSVEALDAELVALVDTADQAGLNALFFQVRPESDALYASSIEPWSRWLSGTQGVDPGIDPLARLIALARPRGIEVHAWLNPYRAKTSKSSAAAANHVSVRLGKYAYTYGGQVYMDPGAPAVEDHIVAVVDDLVRHYDLDGVHFDDYFYPYPNGSEFPDGATYAVYRDGGGTLARDDWRRDNINRMIGRVHDAIVAVDPTIRFGVSPFGIYRPGTPAGITGFDAWAGIYCDPLAWLEAGDVDYVAPQLYWTHDDSGQAYEPLVDWWTEAAGDEAYAIPGNNLSALGTTAGWTVEEYATQVALGRAAGAGGQLWYNASPLLEDRQGIRTAMASWYATPALPPPVAAAREFVVAPPIVHVEGNEARVDHPEFDSVSRWVIYRSVADENGAEAWQITNILSADVERIALEPGTWAISAVDWADVESQGVVVTRP